MTRAENYFAWQSRLVARELGARVVEVGCGIGNFTALLLDRDLVIALDREAACIANLRARFPERANLQTMVGDAANGALRDLARWRPDSVVCVNVLEHIDDDAAALRSMAEILVPGGVIVLLVPAFPALFGPIDRNLGHCRRYRRGPLAKLARSAGLEIRKLHYVNMAGFFGWWVNARVLKRETQSDGQIAVFDRWIVPALSAIESAIPPPFGQSLLAVLRKPGRDR